MKEQIFKKMIEFGWHIGDDETRDFERVYDKHYNFIETLYDYFSDKDMDSQEFDLTDDATFIRLDDMTTFISDFLRAINEIDRVANNVGNSEIKLTNSNSHVPLPLSNLCYDNANIVENEIRKSDWNAENILAILNYHSNRALFGAKALYYTNWKSKVDAQNLLTFVGVDAYGNNVVLSIERGKNNNE